MRLSHLNNSKYSFFKASKNYIMKEETDFHSKETSNLLNEFFIYSLIKDNSKHYFRKLHCVKLIFQNHDRQYTKRKAKEIVNRVKNFDADSFIVLFYFENTEDSGIFRFCHLSCFL